MNKILTSAFVSFTSIFIAGSALAGGHDSCGDITIAEMDWASAELIAPSKSMTATVYFIF